MAFYLVERKQPQISNDQLVTAQRAAIAMSQRFTAEGKPTRYVRTTLIPGEGRCLTLFEAPSAKVVQEVNEAAQIPFDRIIEALELTA
jgi:muconolactone delta-isomerase